MEVCLSGAATLPESQPICSCYSAGKVESAAAKSGLKIHYLVGKMPRNPLAMRMAWPPSVQPAGPPLSQSMITNMSSPSWCTSRAWEVIRGQLQGKQGQGAGKVGLGGQPWSHSHTGSQRPRLKASKLKHKQTTGATAMTSGRHVISYTLAYTNSLASSLPSRHRDAAFVKKSQTAVQPDITHRRHRPSAWRHKTKDQSDVMTDDNVRNVSLPSETHWTAMSLPPNRKGHDVALWHTGRHWCHCPWHTKA